MLYEFIELHREAIIAQTRKRVQSRPWPSVSPYELEHGVPKFLTQLVETLRLEATPTPFPSEEIGATAARHGGELLRLGFNVSQVVHDYGDICQAVTEIAVAEKAPITVEEFHTLNRCLDTAIAEAVTEHARITAQARAAAEVERLGHAAHELRDILNTALLGFHALKRGAVAINGSTGAILGRSLMNLRDVIDRTLSEVRLNAGSLERRRIGIADFIDELSTTAVLHAEYRELRFVVEPVDSELVVRGDLPLLTSAVMNLLHNAFKFTRRGGVVRLRAHAVGERLLIEIEDECGGIPESELDLFQAFGDRRGADRSGLSLGLSIARKAARAHQGDIRVHNRPGHGCTFSVELPLVGETETEVEPAPAS
jgi:signal transduction histidine kinase